MLRKLILLITTILLLTFATLVQAQQYNNWRLAQAIECDSTTYNYVDTYYYHPNSFSQVDSLKRHCYSDVDDYTRTYHCLYSELSFPGSTRYQYDFLDSIGAVWASNSITKDNLGRPVYKVLTDFINPTHISYYTMCYSNSIQPDTLIETLNWSGSHYAHLYVNTYDELSRKQHQDVYNQVGQDWSFWCSYDYSYINPFPLALDLISQDPFMDVETLFDATWQINDIIHHSYNGASESTYWTCNQNENISFIYDWSDGANVDTLIVTYNSNGLKTGFYGHSIPGGGRYTSIIQYIWEQVVTDNSDILSTPMINLSVFPNPFYFVANLSFGLKKAEPTHLFVYNLKGQKVRTLQSGLLAKGMHTITWNGKDDNGKPVSSGIYLFRLESGKTVTTPPNALGPAYQQFVNEYWEKYQAGNGGDLKSGLKGVDKSIDDALALATGP